MREAMVASEADRADVFEAALEDEPGRLTKQAPEVPRPRETSPPLRAISLGAGEESPESDDPNDPAARPQISLVGPAGAAARQARSRRARGERGDEAAPRRSGEDSASHSDDGSKESR